MNLIFGKYQIILNPYLGSGDGQQGPAYNKLCLSKFCSVYGFGLTRVLWLLATVGCKKNSRILSFYSNRFINKEKHLSRIHNRSFFSLVGIELKQASASWVYRSKNFGVRKGFSKKIIKNSSRKKKLFPQGIILGGYTSIYRCFV